MMDDMSTRRGETRGESERVAVDGGARIVRWGAEEWTVVSRVVGRRRRMLFGAHFRTENRAQD